MLCVVRAGVLCMIARVGLVYCAVSIACSVVVSVNVIVLPCTVLIALCMMHTWLYTYGIGLCCQLCYAAMLPTVLCVYGC